MSITSFSTPDSSFKTEFINCTSCTITGTYGLDVWLYDDSAFTSWSDTITTSSTELEQTLKSRYSSYTLRMKCNIDSILNVDNTGDKSNWACCLRDLT